jgi:hypothetical protein
MQKYADVMLPVVVAAGDGDSGAAVKALLKSLTSMRIKFHRDFFVTKAELQAAGGDANAPLRAYTQALVQFVRVESALSREDIMAAGHRLVRVLQCLEAVAEQSEVQQVLRSLARRVPRPSARATLIAAEEEIDEEDMEEEKSDEFRKEGESRQAVRRVRSGVGPRRRSRGGHPPFEYFTSAARSEDELLAAEALIARPMDIRAANSLVRAFYSQGWLEDAAVEIAFPLSRLRNSFPTSLPLQMLSAHRLVLNRKHSEAMSRYLDVFFRDPQQPLSALCLAVMLQFIARNPHASSKTVVRYHTLSSISH